MLRNNVVDNFHFNLYRLKNYVNKTYSDENKDEILLIIFNNIINKYPDNKWFKIKDNFFENIGTNYQEWIMIYTIIAYKEGPKFVNSPQIFIDNLCNTLLSYYIEPYNLAKYSHFFLESHFYDLIMQAFNTKSIFPKYIMQIIIENFNLNDMSENLYNKICEITQNFINEFNYKIFNENYDFYNIYCLLKKLIDNFYTMIYDKIDINLLEVLPLFNTINSDTLKKTIQESFKSIENNNDDICRKIIQCFTIIARYAYDIPKYKPTKKI